jgi:signal transduction histidine kinase
MKQPPKPARRKGRAPRRKPSPRSQVAAELGALNQELERRLSLVSARVINAQEAERRHLARELHDEIGQQLTGLNMLLHRAGKACGKEARPILKEAQKAVAELLQQVRRMSMNLRPQLLDDLGLRSAVESHIKDFSKRTAVPVKFSAEDFAEAKVSPSQRIVAFRIMQEALTNAARHATPRHVGVRLRSDDENLFVEVADDGKGFDISAPAPNGGSGLAGMRERVLLAGGQLKIESSMGHGTHVSATLPLRGRKQEEPK